MDRKKCLLRSTAVSLSNGSPVGTEVTPVWLRIPESELATLEIQTPSDSCGDIGMVVRGVVEDVTLSGTAVITTEEQTLVVTVEPAAIGLPSEASAGMEDQGGQCPLDLTWPVA